MIERNDEDNYVLVCDCCSNYIEDFYEFEEAVEYKKENGWKSIRKDGEWIDKCPNCLEDDNE